MLFPRIDLDKEIEEINTLVDKKPDIREDEDLDKANTITIDQFAEVLGEYPRSGLVDIFVSAGNYLEDFRQRKTQCAIRYCAICPTEATAIFPTR